MVKRSDIRVAVLIGMLALGTAAPALAAAPTAQQYRDALSLRDRWEYLTRDVAFPANWVAGTHDFVFRKTVAGGFAFIRENADTGATAPAFDRNAVARSLGKAMDERYDPLRLPFTDIDYADAGKVIVFEIDEKRWRCSVSGDDCAPVQSKDRPRGFGVVRDLRYPANNTPHVSPDGRWEVLAHGYNLVIQPVGGGPATVLSQDGTQGDFYDPESIQWSPDSRKIVAYRIRPGFPRYVTRILSSPTDRLQPEIRKQLYPKPGDAIDLERPVLFHVASDGKTQQVDVSDVLFPNPYQLTDLHWRRNSATFAFEFTQRGHQHAKIVEVNADTGAARAVVSEDAKTFIWQDRGYWHDVGDAGKELIWLSERDGWAHLYLYDDKSGRVENKITTGDWPVRHVVRVDDKTRQIWFAASGINKGEDPYFVHYYRINFDGTGLTVMTPIRADHSLSFSSDGQYYVDTYSRVDMANVAELHRTSDGTLVRTIAKGDISRLMAAGYKLPQPFVAKGRDGKTDIWGLIVKPLDFDPNKKYPVIENIYAGPHDSFVPKTFWPFGYHSGGDKVIGMQELADMGFVVVQIDGMGTANRSKAFQDVAWKDLADSGFPDRILWHKAAAAQYPWYDISHGVGIYGGSAGGQSTVSALLFHPDFYRVGVAFAGCYDNRMDKISWNEQWLGWPVDDSYLRSSDVVNAGRLKGHLLMIFGEQDSNVDPSSSLQLVNALIKAKKDFSLIEVPGGEHTTGRSSGPIDYAERRQFGFFVRNLLGEATPDWNSLPTEEQ